MGKVGTMDLSIVDRLLVTLFDKPRNVPMAMREAGHTQDDLGGLAGSPYSRLHRINRARHGSIDPAGKARAAQVSRSTP